MILLRGRNNDLARVDHWQAVGDDVRWKTVPGKHQKCNRLLVTGVAEESMEFLCVH